MHSAVGYLNSCMQMYLGRTDTLDFDFDALGPTNQSARQISMSCPFVKSIQSHNTDRHYDSAARFGCKLSVKLSPSKIYTYTVDNTFPTKKSAKEAVAKVAVRQDIVRLAKEVKEGGGQSSSLSSASGSAGRSASPRTSLNGTYTVPAVTHTRAVPQGYPDLRAEDADGEAANGHAPYATTANRRSFGFSLARSPEHEHVVASPPPYSRHVSAPPSALPVTAFAPAVVRNPSQQQGIAPNGLLPAQQNPIIQQQRYMQQGRPDPHYLSSANGIAAPRNTMNTAEQRSALTGQHAPAASRAAAQPVAQQNQASAEQPYLRAIAEYAAARVTGPVQESVKYMIKRNPTSQCNSVARSVAYSADIQIPYQTVFGAALSRFMSRQMYRISTGSSRSTLQRAWAKKQRPPKRWKRASLPSSTGNFRLKQLRDAHTAENLHAQRTHRWQWKRRLSWRRPFSRTLMRSLLAICIKLARSYWRMGWTASRSTS